MAPTRCGPRGLLPSTALLLGLAFAAGPAFAQTPAWIKLPPPASVGLHVSDTLRDRELFFDSMGLLALPDGASPAWQRAWIGTNPPTTADDFAFYDPARDEVWTLTKAAGDSIRVWTLDLSSPVAQWTAQPFVGNPTANLTSMTYAFDPTRDRVLLFGGFDLDHPGTAVNDVWALSLSGTPAWSLAGVSGTPPTPRAGSAMVYDPWRDRVVIYGGVSFGPTYDDQAWSLSLDAPMTWTHLTPAQLPPQGRSTPATALDTAGRRWILMGGDVSGGNAGGETWALDLSAATPATTANWTSIPTGVYGPRPPQAGALFAQPAQACLLNYDGADLWRLGLGANPAWDLPGGGALGLVRRSDLVTFVDPEKRLVYAGLGPDSTFQVRPLDADVAWTQIPGPGPGPVYAGVGRYGAVAVTDDAARRAYVFGGAEGAFVPGQPAYEDAKLWSFDLDGGGWTLLAPASPPLGRAEALGVFDTAHRRLIVHGGRYTNPAAVPLGDTWVYDATNGTWSSPPTGDYGAWWGEVGIYDPVRDRVVSFGGTNAGVGGALQQDVHVLPLGTTIGTWSTLTTSGTPPGWLGSASVDVLAAAYDSTGDRMIVLGGNGPATSAWALTLGANPTWSLLQPVLATPVLRTSAALVADPAHGRMLLVGGEGASGDTWALVFDKTTPVLLSLLDSEVSAGAVRLRWYAGEATAATVERRSAGDGWVALGSARTDGDGILSWVDRAVVAGGSYDYRLAVGAAGALAYSGETHVDVPSTAVLALAAPRPNPSRGPLAVEFSLASGGPAWLELFDVRGRRVLARAVGAAGPGPHTLALDLRHERPGLYFLRLVQGDRVARARLVVAP